MRTFFGIVLLVLGIPIAVAGGVAAVYVGPDNTIDVVDEELTTDTAVVVTDTAALDFTGPTLRVTADVDGAETFVGIAHPVHVDSYLNGVATELVTDVTWRGDVTRETVDGDQQVPPVAPGELDWWHDQSTGSGPQEVSFELTDQPTRIVVASTEPAAPLAVQITADVEIDGLFVTALLVTAAGVVLVVGGILLLRSGRRRKAEARALDADMDTDTDTDLMIDLGEPDPSSPEHLDAPPESPHTPPEPPRIPPRSPGTLPRLAVIAGAGALVLAGCAQLPGDAEHRTNASVPAIAPSAAEEFFTHYTEVNNQANSKRDPELIGTVETGTLLASSSMGYKIEEAQDREPVAPFTVTPSTVAAPALNSYPMWFFASDPGDGSGPGYYLVTRKNAAAPWLVTLSVYPSADAPVVEPVVDGGVAEPAAEDLIDRGEEVLAAVATYAETGDKPDGIDVSAAGGLESLPKHGLHVTQGPDDKAKVNRSCSMRDDEVQWLATKTGAFAMAAISCKQTVKVSEDYNMKLPKDGFGTLPGGIKLQNAEITHGVSFVVTIDDDGSAAVIGESMLPYAMDYAKQ